METPGPNSEVSTATGSASRAVWFLLRAFLGGLVAILFFLWAVGFGNRGFLPSTGRELWLEIAADGPLISVREGDAKARPPARIGVWRVFVEERGMGRIHGPASSWRSTVWSVQDAYGPDGVELDFDPKKPDMERLDEILDPIVRSQIIPGRRVLAGWEQVPVGNVSHDPCRWMMVQSRSRPIILAAIVGISLGVGLGAATLVSVPWRGAGLKAAPRR